MVEKLRSEGVVIAFDANFRPQLWPDASAAREARRRIMPLVDIALPSIDDEDRLWGSADGQAHARRWLDAGAREVAVKLGKDGCLVATATTMTTFPTAAVPPRDTSGASDAFNAGYLHARMMGASRVIAAVAGNDLARWVITRPGALPVRDPEAPYADWSGHWLSTSRDKQKSSRSARDQLDGRAFPDQVDC